jgi:hypothetical protein
MTKKLTPFYDELLQRCPITNEEVLDDCHITIEFGYGSDLDCMTYKFSPVHDSVGKKVLKTIDSMIKGSCEEHPILGVQIKNRQSVEDFGKDVMNEVFGLEDEDIKKTKEEREV